MDLNKLRDVDFTAWTLRIQAKILEVKNEGQERDYFVGLLMKYVGEGDRQGVAELAEKLDVPLSLEKAKAKKNAKLRERILNSFSDSLTDWLYYDRKEDDELPPQSIEKAVKEGLVTVEELVEKLRECFK